MYIMSYQSKLTIRETQFAIRELKSFFQNELSNSLNIERISGPLIVDPVTGLNDNLTGNNNAVSFEARHFNKNLEVVQSLAKWKRFALRNYGFNMNEGIYVDMNAIRSHEKPDELHSLYVDQWDWELIIDKKDRTVDLLKEIVTKIYSCILTSELHINAVYPQLSNKLPRQIKFYDTQEIDDMYPNTSFEEATKEIVKKDRAVFFIGIGKKLKSGRVFDDRAPDYDDWALNGDLFVWSDVINKPIELSSMGIRVNKESLISQSNIKDTSNLNDYYKMVINDEIDQTIGGGIGQSRLCMFLLEKKHVGEVQSSVWDDEQKAYFAKEGIKVL